MGIASLIEYVILILLIIGTVLVILTDEDGDSGRKISWILVVVLVPVVGILCYVVFGLNHRGDRKYERYARKVHEAFVKH